MNISGKVSALLLILIFSLTFGQEAKEDSGNYEAIKSIKDTIQCENTNYKFRSKNDKFGWLAGHVTDQYGNPLNNVSIIISGTTYGAETDEEGYYWVIGIKEGIHTLVAIKNEYKSQVVKNAEIRNHYVLYQDFVISKLENTKSINLPTKNNDESNNNCLEDIEIEVEWTKPPPDVTKSLRKPIIYLYPEKETDVNVKLDYKGTFTATYPKYPESGWTVTAKPDGTLIDKNGKEYYSLFWEGVTNKAFTMNEGKVVKKEDTAEFLENSLRILGLNYKEANEFIIYWLPELEKHPYNLIHFSTKEYEELAELTVTPAPDTVIRVFMVFKALDKPVEIKEQVLVPKSRKGFTVVEWGGSEVKEGSKSQIK